MENKEIKVAKYCIYSDWLPNYPANEHWEFVGGLACNGWQSVKLSEMCIDTFKTEINIIVCVTYDDFDLSQLKAINNNNIVIYRLDDVFPFKVARQQCIRNADYVCGPYMYLKIEQIYSDFNRENTFWIPYSVPDVNIPKEPKNNSSPWEKVLISGRLGPMYPFRNMMVKISEMSKSIDYLEHCGGYIGEDGFNHEVTKDKYIEYLSKHLVCFTDGLIYQYVPLKVFEITAAGSLLLVDERIKAPLGALGFEDRVNCVFCNTSNVIDVVAWCLDKSNRYEVDKIRKEGQKLTYDRHLTSQRIKLFEHELMSRLKTRFFKA